MYSVIVPVYKVENYLSKCIESILAQTYSDFELILVDDGSPDKCPSICDKYEKKDNRVKVVHKKNGGLISARKAGLKIAKGEYICFVDGDDFISNDMLETFEQELDKTKVDVICTGYSEYYNKHNIKTISQPGANKVYDKNKLQSEIYQKMLSTTPFFTFYIFPTVWSKCFKKGIAKKIYKDIPDEISIGEDAAATYSALLEADSVSILNYNGYMYRQNPYSMTHIYDENLYKKMKNLLSYLKEIQIKYNWNEKNQINEYTMFLLILAKDNEFKYNFHEKYKIKKRNMKKYLSDPIFYDVLKNLNLNGLKNKFLLFCFKRELLIPIDLYEKIAKKKKWDD